jgi:hypothetical protein
MKRCDVVAGARSNGWLPDFKETEANNPEDPHNNNEQQGLGQLLSRTPLGACALVV